MSSENSHINWDAILAALENEESGAEIPLTEEEARWVETFRELGQTPFLTESLLLPVEEDFWKVAARAGLQAPAVEKKPENTTGRFIPLLKLARLKAAVLLVMIAAGAMAVWLLGRREARPALRPESDPSLLYNTNASFDHIHADGSELPCNCCCAPSCPQRGNLMDHILLDGDGDDSSVITVPNCFIRETNSCIRLASCRPVTRKKDKLLFTHSSLEDVMKAFAMHYDLNYHFLDDDSKRILLNGIVTLTPAPHALLHPLEQATGLKLRMCSDTVFISHK
ncbi:hypothetical protein [Chitinophaga vietnamensis]|uniref:hypothetical protein n=1 Tax=Chitinophaga vietnamensis TaxID=2593957 RepID=UPI001177F91E|nr:hypothetical protein [Chitinophaga vietnamensis]